MVGPGPDAVIDRNARTFTRLAPGLVGVPLTIGHRVIVLVSASTRHTGSALASAAVAGPVVSMLPARNASAHLAEHLDSVARFADAVVALDDGSTDDTGDILRAHPLVQVVLTNPRRSTYAGWDDLTNRSRLLEAALELEASWAMSLDADELMTGDDAQALRRFITESADRDHGYLFRVLRMIDDLDHHSAEPLWVGRLFAPRPGHRFSEQRLHFVPLPTAIDRERWMRTTFRILHRGALTELDRRARLDKYREADPDHRWQSSYRHLTSVPRRLQQLAPRGRLLPALAHAPVVDEVGLEPDEPALSVVIIGRGDSPGLARAVAAAVGQEVDEPFEVVVVTSGPGHAAEQVSAAHPQVRVVRLSEPALPGAARNAGLAASRGRWITFPGSHVELTPGSLARRLAAHRAGWPMVTEVMVNGTDTSAGWASWFLDNTGFLPGAEPAPLTVAPIRCSYHRSLLEEVGGFPDVRTGEDTAVNEYLFEQGYGAWWETSCVTIHHSPCTSLSRLVRHHHQRGRGRARLLMDEWERGTLSGRAVVSAALRWMPGRLRWMHGQVQTTDRQTRYRYRRVLPQIVAGAGAAALGCWLGLAREFWQRRS